MIIYYTHKKFGESKIIDYCFHRLFYQVNLLDTQMVAVVPTQKIPVPLNSAGIKYIFKDSTDEGISDIYDRIMLGLDQVQPYEQVYLAEHDVLYSDEHFKAKIKGLGYNLNYTYLSEFGFFQRHVNCLALSQLTGYAYRLDAEIEKKLTEIKEGKFNCFEPTNVDSNFKTIKPCIDIRHKANQTWKVDKETDTFWQDIPYWGNATKIWKEITE